MRTIIKVFQKSPLESIHVVESEPGDLTRYVYIVARLGDEFKFMPFGNTFSYPDKLLRFEIPDKECLEFEDVVKIIDENSDINPNTVYECCHAIFEIYYNNAPELQSIRDVLGEYENIRQLIKEDGTD